MTNHTESYASCWANIGDLKVYTRLDLKRLMGISQVLSSDRVQNDTETLFRLESFSPFEN